MQALCIYDIYIECYSVGYILVVRQKRRHFRLDESRGTFTVDTQPPQQQLQLQQPQAACERPLIFLSLALLGLGLHNNCWQCMSKKS